MCHRRMIAVIAAYAISGCSQQAQDQRGSGQKPPAGQSTAFDLQTRDDLRHLGQLLARQDVLEARILSEQLIGRVPDDDKNFADLLDELDRQLTAQEVEVGDGYLWAHRPPTDGPRWRETLDRVRQRARYLSRHSDKTGLAVLRITVEDPAKEESITVSCEEIITYLMPGGYGQSQVLQSGSSAIFGRDYSPTSLRPGLISIGSLRHACPTIPINIPASGIVPIGELLLRTIPNEDLGSIRVRVSPEGKLPLKDGIVHIGRGSSSRGSAFPLQSDGTCRIDRIAAGDCSLYADARKLFRTPRGRIRVDAGRTTEVELFAYACRQVVVDWKYHRSDDDGDWHVGSSTVLTGEMGPSGIWEQRGSTIDLSEWDSEGTQIYGLSGTLLPADPADFDVPNVRLSDEDLKRGRGRQRHPVSVGATFAYRSRESSRDVPIEAVLRIRSIEPVVPLIAQPAN